MTKQEIKKSKKMLAEVGRVVTGTIRDERGRRPVTAIETDGDGHRQPFGTPAVFSSMESVLDYCQDRR